MTNPCKRVDDTTDTIKIIMNVTISLLFLVFIIALCTGSGSDSDSSGSPDDFTLKYVGRQRLEASLKDPDSLEIIEERLIRDGGEVGYFAMFRARNGFGGMSVEGFYTDLENDPEQSDDKTSIEWLNKIEDQILLYEQP